MTDEFNDWWDKDALTQTNPYSENTPVYWAWEGWLAAKRAIEAECRVPDYVWMIGTKGFMALFATEEAANDWQQMNGTNTPASYIQPVSIPVISAAPKPEKAEPHFRDKPTRPALEAVFRDRPEYFEPVAQEPVAEVVPYNGPSGSRVALYAEHKNLPIGTKLYLAPPDQSAEAQREINMALDLDDARERIAELERQQAVLVEALEEARDEVVGWAAYASEYFQQKHNLKGYVEKLDATLASVKGNA